MPGIKTFDNALKELGYASEYALSKEKTLQDNQIDADLLSHTRQPLAQTLDIVIPRSCASTPRQQLLNILGKPYSPTKPTSDGHDSIPEHEYVNDNERRQCVLSELITTEENFINKLRNLVDHVVVPIKRHAADAKHFILNPYMCTNIFVNLENILKFHEQFLRDLTHGDVATACATHLSKLNHVHRPYLLKVNESIRFHKDQIHDNDRYKAFIKRVTSNASFGAFQVHELLNEPWKRITVYPMLLKDIRNLTKHTHRDFDKLTKAYGYANRAASVHQDAATHCATTCHRLFSYIRKTPADVINQRRNLIDHLDAVELNPVTGKLDNYVTLFLLSDKILVAKRYDYVRGAEICSDNPINSFPVLGKNKSNKGLKFKFAGWIGLQHVELLKGGSDTPSDTFIIRASADFQEEVKKGDVKRNDKYFQSGAHLFTYQKHMDQLTSWNAHSARFIDSFYKTQAALRQRGDNDATYTSNWKQITNVYCNVFDPESYKKQHIKNNVAVLLLDQDLDLASLLESNTSAPWIIAVVRPDQQGLKLKIYTKVMLSCLHDDHAAPAVQDQAGDFATIFFNNVIACERKLRCSSTYKTINETVEEQEADQRPARFRSRSRSRSQSKGSRSRSTSITSFGKLFNRSRSQSPFSSSTSLLNKVIPTASKSTPSSDAANQPQAPAKRPRALSMTNDVRPSSGTGRRGSFQLKPSTSSSSTASNTRRKLSFDASYASNFFKFESKSTASTALASTITASPAKTPIPTQKQQKDALPSCGASPGASSCSTTSSAASSTPSVFMQHQQQQPQALNPQRHRNSMSIFTTLRSHSPSPTAAVQPADLPPPAYLKPTSTANATSNKPSPTSFDTNKQRQLCDKLNTIFQSALKPTTTPMSATAAHRDVHQRRFSEAVLSSPTSMSTTSSISSSPVSSSSPSLPAPGASPTSTYGTSSSSRSSFSNTFSSYASQSSRSSYSLEELDQLKPQGPYFHLLSTDMFANQQHDNSMLDDELAKKVITDKAASYRLPKSLAPRHDPDMLATASVTSSGSDSTVMPRTDLSRPATDPNSQFFIDKKAMLGNQIQRVSERLPQQHDAEVDILSDLYQDTMDEAVSLISKQRMELDEIQHILHAYRAQRQQQELASAPLRPVITDETPDALYKRKLREIEKERDYWHRRASELADQIGRLSTRH